MRTITFKLMVAWCVIGFVGLFVDNLIFDKKLNFLMIFLAVHFTVVVPVIMFKLFKGSNL